MKLLSLKTHGLDPVNCMSGFGFRMSTNFFLCLLGWDNDNIFKFCLVLIYISTVLESTGIFVPKKVEISYEHFFSDGWPSREACTLNTNCAFKLKAWTIIYIKCECWLNTEYQFLLIGERNAGDCDTRLWKMGGRGQGNELANNANCYTCAGGVLLIYLAPKCEEQREVCKPDCYKSSEKIWARLERDSGRGFQFWNFVYKVNCRHNGGKDGEAKIYLNRHLLCFIFTFA